MIAKSDLIILVISASALGLGLYRWQQNTAVPSSASLSAPVSAPAAPVGSPAEASGAAGSTPAVSNTAPRPAAPPTEPRVEPQAERPSEPLVGRRASENLAPAPAVTPASGSDRQGVAGAEATERNDGALARRVPATDSGSVATPSTAGTPPDALPERVRSAAGTDPATPTSVGAGESVLYGRYRVVEGDYLGLIAERFGTSVTTLRSINDIEGNLILVGQELRYPLPAN